MNQKLSFGEYGVHEFLKSDSISPSHRLEVVRKRRAPNKDGDLSQGKHHMNVPFVMKNVIGRKIDQS